MRVASGDAPGAARDADRSLNSARPLSAQTPLFSSSGDGTLKSGLIAMAHIFGRWTNRRYMNEGEDFRKGLAHLLPLSCSDLGTPS